MSEANVSSSECSYSLNFIIPVTIVFTLTTILVIFENTLICIAVIRSPLRQIKSNWFLVGLSVADMFTSLTITPLQILEVWTSPQWPLGQIGVNIYNSLWNFILIVPFLTVLAITIDRFLVITKQINMSARFSARWVLIVLFCIWLYSAVIVSLLSLSFYKAPTDEYVWNVPYQFYYPFLGIHVFLPLLIICYCYIKILKEAYFTKKQLSGVLDSTVSISNRQRSEIKLAKTVGYVVLALVTVWIPVLAMEIVYAVDSGHSCLVNKIGIISVWLTCTNGIINPFIYSMRSQQFKDVLKKLLKCKKNRIDYES